ncbi:MAG TPA: hypothetical protein VHX38_28595 [Pseudonocardiaceae bacterium]|jgi:hypothetical protein|nr:hypothetical protein [Pseudonocardiaceae bacterium]
MHAPITVNYVPDGGDWRVTVTDEEQTQNATASGLIAARDQADQIVEKMMPNQVGRTVVHLLEGDAVAFTNTYLQVRLGLTTPPPTDLAPDSEPESGPAESTTAGSTTADSATAAEAASDATPAPTDPAATDAATDPTGSDLAAPEGAVPSPTEPKPAATTPEAPPAPTAAAAAEKRTETPAKPPTKTDKKDQVTEIVGSSTNQVN